MIAVIQRVHHASVIVDNQTVGAIQLGLLVLAAIHADDTDADLLWTANKLTTLRIFPSTEGDKVYDRDVKEVAGSLLLVSNFTLAADTRTGRRPSLNPAASPSLAEPMFNKFVQLVRATAIPTHTGTFGADMRLDLANDGPCTFLLDSRQSR